MDNIYISKCITLLQEIVNLIRIQSYSKASNKLQFFNSKVLNSVELNKLINNPEEGMYSITQQMLNALGNNDMTLFADIIEDAMVPYMKSLVVPEDEIIYGDYCVETTSIGAYTLKSISGNKYLHTNVNPYEEARNFINTWVDKTSTNYAVLGLGLGYHVQALDDRFFGGSHITVFEKDEDVITLCEKYGCELNKDNIDIIYDPDATKFCKYIEKNDSGIVIHYPSLQLWGQSETGVVLKRFYSSINSWIDFKDEININYLNNIKSCKRNVDELKKIIDGRDIIIVAAGPSLDRSKSKIEIIRRDKNAIVIAVSTVFRKLLKANTKPDYVIVMDPQERTYGHMEGIEECDIPMIVDSAAFWKFARLYGGEKYIALQQGYEPAESLANSEGFKLYETGGSVTTLALDIAIKLGAKSITFFGTDMSFPGGLSHADDTMDQKKQDNDKLITIKDVNGRDVKTDELMLTYLRWIEDKIKANPQLNYYNVTDSGAMIQGTKTINPIEYD